MAVRVQSFPKKNFGQSSIHSMPHFSVNGRAWWNSHDQQFPQSLSKNLSLKMGSPPQYCQEAKQVGCQPQDQEKSSSQSTSQSHQEVTAVEGANQDHRISSDSVQDESYRKHVEGQMKPVLFMGNPNFGISPSQVDINQSMTHIPYPYADPYFNGLYTAYGPQAIIQPQMVGIAPARVPLPLDVAEDGPIYVNAKQYHGILRRRQTRAKLEARNKLIKNRRPYLHESRHLHALNRVRGSGGRFLSTKKSQHPDPSLPTSSHYASNSVHFRQNTDTSEIKVHQLEVRQLETGKCETPSTSTYSVMNGDVIFQQPDRRFSSISPHGVPMQGSGGLICNGTQHRAPVVR